MVYKNWSALRLGDRHLPKSHLTENQKRLLWPFEGREREEIYQRWFDLLQYAEDLEGRVQEEKNRLEGIYMRLNKVTTRLERLLSWNENDGWVRRLVKKWAIYKTK